MGELMRQGWRSGHRALSAAVLLIVGGAVAIAAWVGGHPGVAAAVIGTYVVLAGIAFAWSGGRGDVAAMMRGGGDERQRLMDLRATAAASIATALFAICGAVVNIARTGGDPGPYGVICVVFGVTYGVALVVLRRRA
jgi:hypothetical protein